jgi:hypothetical protein
MSSQIFNGRLDPQFNPFDNDYLVEILEATAVAWARMKRPGTREIEDHITYRLAGRLANDPHFAELPYDIVTQCWLLGWTESGLVVWTYASSTGIRNVTTLHSNRSGCT